jgi:triacylglycerol esterase/lipase EstA (alpha/beta hydrolase family)
VHACRKLTNFEQPFIDQHIPYFDEFNMVNATAEVHAPFLRGRIDVATRRFGAKYVNLVGHSKGGIDSRVWIATDAGLRSDYPVLSLTTVATPHHGSANADYAQNAFKVNAMYSDNTFRVSLARAAGTNLGHQSLTTEYGRTLQLKNLDFQPRGPV